MLKKEKLYVTAERTAIRDAYMQVDELCDQLLRLAWKTQRLNWGLDQVLSRQQSIEQWEKSRRAYDSLQLTSAHSRFGGHGTVRGRSAALLCLARRAAQGPRSLA